MQSSLPLADASVGTLIAVFAAATALIVVSGTRLAALADRLADRTGMGEAMMGALFLGVSTSLPGITASVTAALDGHPALAVSNAMGGIAVQTAFLAVADVFHRRANLEHAAASATNLVHAAVLIVLLALVAIAIAAPSGRTVGHVDMATPVIIGTYVFGLTIAYRSEASPMWHPRITSHTVSDEPDEASREWSLSALWSGFAVSAIVVMASGAALARSAGLLASKTGVSESLMGALFVAVSTSLPELVTTVAAVRRGALTLAVSDIVGGNAFDVLFVCVADAVYLEGSIYRLAGAKESFVAALAILLNGLLLLGLLRRQRHGVANIGFESALILVAYVASIAILVAG